MGTQSDFRVKKNLIVGDGIISSDSGNLVLRRDFDDSDWNQITLGDNTYKITLSNDDRFYIDTAGKVGIGTTSPSKLLHLESTMPEIYMVDSDATNDPNVRIFNNNGSLNFRVDDADTGTGGHVLWYTSGTEKMRLSDAGNLGIGTASPGNILDVEESVNDNAQIRIENTNSGGNANQASVGIVSDGNNLSISSYGDSHASLANYNRITTSAGSAVISIDSGTVGEGILVADGGNVGIGVTDPDKSLEVNAGNVNLDGIKIEGSGVNTSLTINNTGTNGGKYRISVSSGNHGDGANKLLIQDNNTTKIALDSTGRVGMGTTSPVALLDVQGTGQGSGGYKKHLLIQDTGTAFDAANNGGALLFGGLQDASNHAYWAKISGEKANTTEDNRSGTLHFWTRKEGGDPLQRMMIDEDGYVGIGTTAPNTALVVRTDNDSDFPQVKIDNAGSGDAALFFSGGSVWSIGVDNSDSDKFKISQDNSNAYLHTNTRFAMTTAGHIGLGTASPGYHLDIQSPDAKINLKDTSDTDDMFVRFQGSDNNEYGLVGYSATSVFQIKSAQGRVINIGGHANVKVGVTTADMTFTPSALFHVNGALKATTKSFDIEHPTKEGMRLHHGVLEGPEHGVYIRGHQVGDTIELPDYWLGLVDEDTITVQLTAKGRSQNLYVKSVDREKVMVAGFTVKSPDFYYFIQAERKDVDKMEVEYGKLD